MPVLRCGFSRVSSAFGDCRCDTFMKIVDAVLFLLFFFVGSRCITLIVPGTGFFSWIGTLTVYTGFFLPCFPLSMAFTVFVSQGCGAVFLYIFHSRFSWLMCD